ncbi:SCO1664 family protein [Kocuria marina]|uniref:SCO1664 family protein n=1 Tax=Kocuria marina TaxID=223184 RepID=UPI0030832BF5
MRAERADELLRTGEITLLGQLARSSNETFLVEVRAPASQSATGTDGDARTGEVPDPAADACSALATGDDAAPADAPVPAPDPDDAAPAATSFGPPDSDTACWAIYKPELGERPLHDFPPGLYRRERAAYLLSEALGWGIVPLTVIRDDAPSGTGSLQLFVAADPREHYFTIVEDHPDTHPALRTMAAFDVLTNNTDRKSGHVLRGRDGRIWGIDHGLCFAAAFKLRTVIWEFAHDPLSPELVADIAALAENGAPPEVAELLTTEETGALRRRARALALLGRLPEDPSGMRYPWPLV